LIKNEHQYKLTKTLVQELEKALTELSADTGYNTLPKAAQKAHASSLKRQLTQYQFDIKEHEARKNNEFEQKI
jgi:hypothetical protein